MWRAINGSMSNLCSSPFWSTEATWKTHDPDFTPCFEKTILTWFPCLFLWIFLPLEIHRLRHTKSYNIPFNPLNVTKLVSILILAISTLAETVCYTFDEIIIPIDIYSTTMECFTFCLFFFLTFANIKCGVPSSGILVIFSFLLAIFGAPHFYTKLRSPVNPFHWIGISDDVCEIGRHEKVDLVSCIVCYPLVVLVLFLNCFVDEPSIRTSSDEKKVCPEYQSTFLSRLFFTQFDRLVWQGFKKRLTEEDLWALKEDMQSAQLVKRFESNWHPTPGGLKNKKNPNTNTIAVHYENQKLLGNGTGTVAAPIINRYVKSEKETSVCLPLCKTFSLYIMRGVVLKAIQDCLTFASPFILKQIIAFVEYKDEYLWHGYFYAISLFAVTTFQSLVSAHFLYVSFRTGFLMRTALISVIYKKALKISSGARRDFTIGEIVNLVAVDAHRFFDVMGSIHIIWSAPLQICLSVFFLWNLLGPSVLAGIAMMVILIPVNSYLSSRMRTLQIRQMKNKDQRVRLMNDILSGIKILKLYAWEPSFEKQITHIRNKEIEVLRDTAYLTSYTSFVWACAPFLVSSVTFAVYVLSSEEHVLDAQTAFVSLSLFNILRFPLSQLPVLISSIVQTTVSMKRINKFLNSEELDPQAVCHEELREAELITIEHGQFSWEGYEVSPTLRDINVKVTPGSLVAVVGPVGSGKSSLLSAILGEMYTQSGFVNTVGRIAYVPQQAWMQNATFKDNITFGETSNRSFYKRVLEACDLSADLKILPGGDRCEIGEKGVNLSGGQKQRISLARAVFVDADIYLLDDPLSAVDARVGKHIFERVVGPNGILRKKTRVLVTHSLTYLPSVDFIIVLQNGIISDSGTYRELLDKKGEVAEFLTSYAKEETAASGDQNEINTDILSRHSSRSRTGSISTHSLSRQRSVSESESRRTESEVIGQTLIEAEESETGNIQWKVYFDYMRAVGPFFVTATMVMNLLFQTFSLASNYWLSVWSSDVSAVNNDNHENAQKQNLYLVVYALLGVGQAVFVVFQNIALFLGALRASVYLHNHLLKNVLHFPITFFDKTPVGRILNRFSFDVDVCDSSLPRSQMQSLRHWSTLMTTLCILIYSTPLVIVIIVPLGLIYYFVQKFYLNTTRQLKRMESISRSPMYSHLAEMVSGVHSIRAYGLQKKFILTSENMVDHNLKCCYTNMVSNRWLAIRLEIMGNLIIFFSALFATIHGQNTLIAGIVGLSISYALQITQTLNWLLRSTAEVESNVVAVERIKEYDEVQQEAAWKIAGENMPPGWPEKGDVVFEKFQVRYREGLELVLKGITLHVKGGEKIGIVGRTGAGKSSLTLSLFRIIESSGGKISIDGVDISKIGLHTLRRRLTIIPQDPVLFAGTLRVNLDPSESYADERIWEALELAGLKAYVSNLNLGLQHEVTEGGDNFSVGQRQLICLARALLRKTKILIMDEATAAVDLETDVLIQETIRKQFNDCTVFTIAHRLNTILDYDRIIVLDKGRVSEFDSPGVLLESKQTVFHSMATDARLV